MPCQHEPHLGILWHLAAHKGGQAGEERQEEPAGGSSTLLKGSTWLG